MKVWRDLDELPPESRGGAVSIGNFDGLHLGHRRLVECLRDQADRLGRPAVVFTFDPSPIQLLRPEAAPDPLTTIADRLRLLEAAGVDGVIVYPTDRRLLNLSAREFFDQIIIGSLQAQALVEGWNFRFGKARTGDVALLRQWAEAVGVDLEVVEPVQRDGMTVSSSVIRSLLQDGRVEQAARLLGRPYTIRGRVVRGAGRGAGLGFPTANVADVATLLPGPGVYAGRGRLNPSQTDPSDTPGHSTGAAGGQQQSKVQKMDASVLSWPAAINLGPNPTFGDQSLKLEAHLIGCQQDLYDHQLEIVFSHRLRDIRTFAGIEDLKSQLLRDVDAARTLARQ